jgi:O-acetyl-ADP-ribose deacetylase (regulator of RNase III)
MTTSVGSGFMQPVATAAEQVVRVGGSVAVAIAEERFSTQQPTCAAAARCGW